VFVDELDLGALGFEALFPKRRDARPIILARC
jgi:hypothetical protein